jgi:class 3 adenylate cyclase
MSRQVIPLPDSSKVEIVINVANSVMPGFGISEPMLLRATSDLQLMQQTEGLGDQILLGAVLTLIAYNFFGWTFGRDRIMRFWLLVLSTMILVKLSLYHPRVTWISLGFTNDSRWVLLFSVLAYYGMILASYQSINFIFGKPFRRLHTALIVLFFTVLSVRLFLLTPAQYYSDLYLAHGMAILLMAMFAWRIYYRIQSGVSYPKEMILSLMSILPFAALAIILHASGNFQARIVENSVFVALIFLLSLWKAKQLAHSNRKLMVEIKKRQHAYKQMIKMVFPHQLRLIQEKCSLEKTMPIGSSDNAIVLCFDLIDSAKIDHPECKSIVTELFRLCHEHMMHGYDGEDLRANAYRINEVGDGFYCSLGFPFQIPVGRQAEELALALAESFVLAADLVSQQYHLKQNPLRCSIGIARGSIHGSFTKHGIQRYELFGDAIVLATRYESMRRILFHAHAWNGHILIVQNTVFAGLPQGVQSSLVEMPLADQLRVRNDDAANALYYRLIPIAKVPHQLAS